MSPIERLDGEAIRRALAGQPLGHTVIVLDEVASTNDAVRELAPEHDDGVALFAESQTAGRGQHGRRWESAAGAGLWFSILLRPVLRAHELHRITAWAAQAVATALREALDLPATVKPPNDIMVNDRKVAGVLFEMRRDGIGVLGIGLNVTQRASDFPATLQHRATSLAMLDAKPLRREDIAVAVLRQLQATCGAEFMRSSQVR